jgi:hypothetical protein
MYNALRNNLKKETLTLSAGFFELEKTYRKSSMTCPIPNVFSSSSRERWAFPVKDLGTVH